MLSGFIQIICKNYLFTIDFYVTADLRCSSVASCDNMRRRNKRVSFNREDSQDARGLHTKDYATRSKLCLGENDFIFFCTRIFIFHFFFVIYIISCNFFLFVYLFI